MATSIEEPPALQGLWLFVWGIAHACAGIQCCLVSLVSPQGDVSAMEWNGDCRSATFNESGKILMGRGVAVLVGHGLCVGRRLAFILVPNDMKRAEKVNECSGQQAFQRMEYYL